MTTHTEWNLMCISEDIEPGDTVIIQNLKDEEIYHQLVYVGLSKDEQWVFCKDSVSKKEYIFNAESLDEKGKRTKEWRILKKSPEGLKLGR